MFLLRAEDTLSQRPFFFFLCTEARCGLILDQGLEGSRGVGSFLPCGNGWDGNHSVSYQPTFKTPADLDLSRQILLTTAPHAPAQSETHHSLPKGIGGTLGFLSALVAQVERIHLQGKRPEFHPWVGKIPWRSERQSIPVFFPGKSHGQESMGLQTVRDD